MDPHLHFVLGAPAADLDGSGEIDRADLVEYLRRVSAARRMGLR